MKTKIVSIITCKKGNSSDNSNYRPSALATACSKIFELCVLENIELHMYIHDHQFGFETQHSTYMGIFTLARLSKSNL